LDFGDVFDGNALWLETSVRPGDSIDPCDFTILIPRLEITLSPYAIYAKKAGAVPFGITGSGTANRIAKFTGPNTIGDSVIFESSGNVGIGLMNPSERLDVAGTARVVADHPSVLFYDVNAPLNDRYLMLRGHNQDLSVVSLLDTMEYEQQIMVIEGTGDVGIGTTNPEEKLHVAGSLKIVDGTQGEGKVLTSDANGLANWQSPASPSVPSGIIVMWSGSIATIPAGWALCDGDNNTPDLTSRFIRSVPNASTEPGSTGGSATHTHSAGSYSSASHTHTYSGTTSEYTADQCCAGSVDAWILYTKKHTHTYSGTTEPGGGGAISGTSGDGSSLPPYYELAFIMKL